MCIVEVDGKKVIPASIWRQLNIDEILNSIDIALQIVKDKNEIDEETREKLIYLSNLTLDIIIDSYDHELKQLEEIGI